MKKNLNFLLTGLLVVSIAILSSCSDDDEPGAENEEEEITEITLTFTPVGGGQAVTAVWFDEDGEDGPIQPTIEEINLSTNTEYALSIELINTLADDPEERDVTTEIREDEPDEHQFFFAWSGDVFSDPTGTGNIIPRTGEDNRPSGSATGIVNYNETDEDENGNPIGLLTNWTTASASTQGVFRVVLKHQPPIEEGADPQKSATSTSDTGSDDINLDFDLNINE